MSFDFMSFDFDPNELEMLSPAESEVVWERIRDYMGLTQALAHVAAAATRFAWSTDDAPLSGMTFEQGCLWDELTAALAVLEEFTPNPSA